MSRKSKAGVQRGTQDRTAKAPHKGRNSPRSASALPSKVAEWLRPGELSSARAPSRDLRHTSDTKFGCFGRRAALHLNFGTAPAEYNVSRSESLLA